MGKLICPVCRSEVKLPEKSSMVFGRLFSKEDKGTHYLEIENVNPNNAKSEKEKENENVAVNLTKENKATARENTLKAAGVDTGKYFSMTLPNGVSITVDEKGNKVEIEKTDEVVQAIKDAGNLPVDGLYRRWVMAQFFRAYNSPKGYTDEMREMKYNYQWKALVDEFRVLAKKQEQGDTESLNERLHFFNKAVVINLCHEYIADLERKIEKDFPVKHQRMKDENGNTVKIPYKNVFGKDFYLDKIESKFMSPIRRKVFILEHTKNYTELYRELKDFVNRYVHKVRDNVTSTFLDAYKGAGAYYTLQNMVLYHGCTLYEYKLSKSHYYYDRWERTGNKYLGMDAYNYMKSQLNELDGQGWRWVGIIRQCIEDNDFKWRSEK